MVLDTDVGTGGDVGVVIGVWRVVSREERGVKAPRMSASDMVAVVCSGDGDGRWSMGGVRRSLYVVCGCSVR